MTIIVCPLDAVATLVASRAPSHAISLLAPGAAPPPIDLPAEQRLHLAFNDIAAPESGLVAPDEAHIAALLSFLGRWNRRSPLLIHCWAGISRSTAAAYIAACVREGEASEAELAHQLRRAAPFVTPNILMVRLADAALGRAGRMTEAILTIGRGAEASAGTPFDL